MSPGRIPVRPELGGVRGQDCLSAGGEERRGDESGGRDGSSCGDGEVLRQAEIGRDGRREREGERSHDPPAAEKAVRSAVLKSSTHL